MSCRVKSLRLEIERGELLMKRLIEFLFAISARLVIIPIFYGGYTIITLNDGVDVHYGPGIWGLVCLPSTLLLGIGIVLSLIHRKSDPDFRTRFDVENFGPLAVFAYIGLLLFVWSTKEYIVSQKMQSEFSIIVNIIDKKVKEQPVDTWMYNETNQLPVPFIPIVYNQETGKYAFTTKFLKDVAGNLQEVKGIIFISCQRVISESSGKTIKIKKRWVFNCWAIDFPNLNFCAHKTFTGDEPAGVQLYTMSYTGSQPWENVLKWVDEIKIKKL